jgi:hypothetical protein
MEKMIRSAFALVVLLVVGLAGIAQAQPVLNLNGGNENPDPTVIQFEQETYILGTYTAGDTVSAVFKFKNVGDADLIIETVKPSCQCSKLEWTETNVKPGGTGQVSARIDTADKEGEQTKYFVVLYNGNPPAERVTLKFDVKAPEGAVKQGASDGDGIK